MTICDDLRQSVLQAAIQGKLTKQLPEDGTAADLLASIKAEKEKLIKEKKIKKEKPLAPISEDEIPFDIPENWEWVQLKDISSILGGKRIPAGSKLSEDKTAHKYIRVADMKNGTVLLNDIKYVPDSIYPQIKNYTISKDDVYITVAGTIEPDSSGSRAPLSPSLTGCPSAPKTPVSGSAMVSVPIPAMLSRISSPI